VSEPAGSAHVAPPPDSPLWRRVHPITPVLRGWKVLVALLVILGTQFGSDIAALVRRGDGDGLLAGLGGVVAVTLVGFAWAWLAWRMTRFAVTDEAVHLRHGILLTPFHNMALMCPATTAADVDRHTEVFAAAATALTSP